jgi:DNA-binding response OmpR family regulator
MPKILIIEDEDIILDPLCEMLRAEDYEVLGAYTGEAGLELAAAERPDVILCDIVLPGKDGYAVLMELCENPRTKDIPVIFLTGQTSPKEIQTGFTMGVDDYLCKPASREVILAALRKQLDKSAAGKRAE